MSQSIQHTPGPWAVGLDQSNQQKTTVYHCPPFGGGGFMKIAVCYEKYGENGCNVPEEEAKANARLIASAPDLHDVVADLQSWNERSTADTVEDILAELGPIIAKAQKALVRS